jgi:glycosyltransferase involved in cell wall biosynthesis
MQRCSGPDSRDKCFACNTRAFPLKVRVAHGALKQAAVMGIPQSWPPMAAYARYSLWSALEESETYVRALREKVNRFVVGDRKAETFFLEHGVPQEKLVTIPQCLPEDALVVQRSSDPRQIPAIDRPLRIGFVGRHDADKGRRVLARAFEELPDSVPAELWIIHADTATTEFVEPLFKDAARFRKQLQSGRIKLFRPKRREEVYRFMAEIDVGVIPSLQFESPSLVMLEFVAQRTPIVRSDSPGMEHVIQDGINGRTFPHGDWRALKVALLEIIETPSLLDRWRERLPAIGHDTEYARGLVELFAGIVSKSRPVHVAEREFA